MKCRHLIISFALFATLSILVGCGGGGGGGGTPAPAQTTYTLRAQVASYLGRYKGCDTCQYVNITDPLLFYGNTDGITVTCNGQTVSPGADYYFTITGLTAGTHNISFSGTNIITSTQSFYTVGNESDGTFIVSLSSSKMGRLQISSSVPSANIYISGIQLTTYEGVGSVITPVLIEDFPVGTRQIYVTKSGYQQTAAQSITVSAGQQANVNFTLVAAP